MARNYRYTVDDCARAADSGEVIYAPSALKGMLGELVSRLAWCNYPMSLWRGECGHLWDRESSLDRSDKCPRCALERYSSRLERMIFPLAMAVLVLGIAFIVCLFMSRPVHAQQASAPNSAYVLMVQCNPAAGFQLTCFHYLMGLIDGANADTRRPVFCIPPTEVPARITYIYYQYASKHPELWVAHRGDVAHVALKEAFPCKSNGGQK